MVILLESMHSGARREFVVNQYEDLSPIFEEFPLTRRIAENAHDLKSAADSIVRYLSGHNLNAWIEDSRFEKSIRGAIAGLGMLAMIPSALSATHVARAPTKTAQGVQSNSFVKPFGAHKEDRFLHNISLLESAGGKMTDHQAVNHGPYRGEKAVGKWGLLPTTIQEILGRQKKLNTLRPEVAPLQAMNRDQMSIFFKKNPHIELHLARFLARHVLHRQGNNLANAAYSWKYGHNLTPPDIEPQALHNSQYVKDFLTLNQGKSVRGLQPMMSKPVTKLVRKSEPEVSFVERVKAWIAAREEAVRESWPQSSNIGHDPGRRRQDDSFQEKVPKNTKEILRHAIEDAKRARKS